ncbi:MAG: hypothetical protein ACNA8W_06490, partial [Bradymonadaceae bacterium]
RTVTVQACAEFDALVTEFEISSGQKAATDPRVAQEIAFQKAAADARSPMVYSLGADDSAYEVNKTPTTPSHEEEHAVEDDGEIQKTH